MQDKDVYMRAFPTHAHVTLAAKRRRRENRMAHNRGMQQAIQGREPSLYARIGGYDVIAAVIDEMLALLKADPRFARFGTGRSADSHRRTRQLIVDQMCSLSAGPCFYPGRDMQTSHAGLGITESEWIVSMEHTSQALIKSGVGDPERSEFLALFEQYRREIVEKP